MKATDFKKYTELRAAELAYRRRLRAAIIAGDLSKVDELFQRAPGDMNGVVDCLTNETFDDYTQARLAADIIEMDPAKARHLLLSAWSHCHRTTIWSLGKGSFVRLLARTRQFDEAIPALPGTFTVYRGQGLAEAGSGLSWTLDRAQAQWFVNVYWPARGGIPGGGIVLERVVKRREVLAVVGEDGREGEQEILLRSR